MSSALCLSLVANLRCGGLTPAETIGILIPPIIEAFCISFLIYTQRDKGRKHLYLVFDSYIYLALCIVDFVAKFDNAVATSLSAFSLVDRIIGGLSGVPIFFYTIFLFLFSWNYLVPIPPQIRRGVKVLWTILIPIIFVLSELGSLLGISYTLLPPPSKELAVTFNSNTWKTIWTLLNSTGLALLILYQFMAFVFASFRIFRHWNRQATGDDSVSRPNTPGQSTLGGIGWLAAGIKLGAIEVLLGFISGVEMSLPRRLLRLLGRGMLAWAVYKGMEDAGTNGLFRVASIDSIEGLPPRRIPVNPAAFRNLIGAPMAETFVKMSPTATTFHTRKNVPDAMKDMKKFDLSFVDEKSGNRGRPGVLPATIIPGLMAQRIAASVATRPLEKRVTVAYDGHVAPVLDVRFSPQTFGDVGMLMKQIEKRSYSDDGVPRQERSRLSIPSANGSGSRSTLSSRRNVVSQEAAMSQESFSSGSEKSKDQKSLNVAGNYHSRNLSERSSGQSRLYNPFGDSSEVLSPPLPDSLESSDLGLIKRVGSSASTKNSFSAIHQLSPKFPPIPPGAGQLRPENINKVARRKPPPPISPRPRSVSQPQLPSEAFASPDIQVKPTSFLALHDSLRDSLDQDVASRTRRRLRTHIENLNSPASVTEAQWATQPKSAERPSNAGTMKETRSIGSFADLTTAAPSTTNFAFSPRVTRTMSSELRSFGGKSVNMDDIDRSPTSVYSGESAYGAEEGAFSPLATERPIGRIARRALGIEQFLEKEKSEASHDGHDAFSSVPQDPKNMVESATKSPMSPPTARRRPRSGVDNIFKNSSKQVTQKGKLPQVFTDNSFDHVQVTPRKPAPAGLNDLVAREAFAAAWRTVESTAVTPKFDSLKKVGSVNVQTTPTPTRRHKVLNRVSMKVDEGRMDNGGPQEEGKRRLTGDREYLRKSRHIKTASVDSEVY